MNLQFKEYRPVLVLAPGVMAGAEKVVLTGLIGLKNSGLNPLMIIIRETRSPQFAESFRKAIPENIESVFVDSTKAFDRKLPKRIANIISSQSLPLVLHSHGFKALIACYLMKGKLPHLHTHHGDTAHTIKVRVYEKIAKIIMKTCDQVIAVSHQMKIELDQKLAPYNRIIVIENMLSLTNSAMIRAERKSKKENQKIELLFVGRLSPEKGLKQFLLALNASPFKESFHLNVIGDGIDRVNIENVIDEYKMNSIVTLHGFISDPSEFFIIPDILIMPSLREGLPMTLIEALASGVPVLANNVGAISSMVKNGHNGFFAKDFDKESWIAALENTTTQYKFWLKNASLEASSVEKRFSLINWTLKTSEIYKKALNI